jgi:hypothetical protein
VTVLYCNSVDRVLHLESVLQTALPRHCGRRLEREERWPSRFLKFVENLRWHHMQLPTCRTTFLNVRTLLLDRLKKRNSGQYDLGDAKDRRWLLKPGRFAYTSTCMLESTCSEQLLA